MEKDYLDGIHSKVWMIQNRNVSEQRREGADRHYVVPIPSYLIPIHNKYHLWDIWPNTIINLDICNEFNLLRDPGNRCESAAQIIYRE